MPQILGPIEPAGTFAGMNDAHLKGGYRVVDSIATRDAIPADRRTAGMVVYTWSDGKTWRLNPDMVSWSETASTAVTSVFGRTGAIVAQADDYAFSQISGMLNAQKIAYGDVSDDEFARLNGVTDNIQDQLDRRAPLVELWAQPQGSGTTPAVCPGTAWAVNGGVSYQRTIGSGATVAGNILLTSSGTTTTSSVAYSSGPTPTFGVVVRALLMVSLDSVDATNGRFLFGLVDNNAITETPGAADNVVAFRLSTSNTWLLWMQRGNETPWSEDTGLTVSPNAVYRLLVAKNAAGFYDFTVNGTKVGSTEGAPPNAYPVDTTDAFPHACNTWLAGSNSSWRWFGSRVGY